MAIKSREDLLGGLSAIIGEEPNEDGIALMEDLTDTLTDYEEKTKEDWKTKYEENDKAWKKKYMDRFMSGSDPEPSREEVIDDEKPKTFEDLFTTEV